MIGLGALVACDQKTNEPTEKADVSSMPDVVSAVDDSTTGDDSSLPDVEVPSDVAADIPSGPDSDTANPVPSEPDSVGKAFVAAVNSQNKGAIWKLFPSDDLLAQSLACETSEFLDDLSNNRLSVSAELDNDLQGVTLQWIGHELRDETTLLTGETQDGCTALVDVTMVHAKWRFYWTEDGETVEEGDGVDLIKLGDAGWFLLKL